MTFGRTDGQIATISNSALSHSYMCAKMNIDFMADEVRANIDYISPFLKGVCHLGAKFHVEGHDVTHQPFFVSETR